MLTDRTMVGEMTRSRHFQSIALALIVVAGTPHSKGGERAASLRSVLVGADRLVVSDTFHEPTEPKKEDVEIEGEKKIAELLGKLEFDDSGSGFHCMCIGDSQVSFYKGDRELATLSHHHGMSLRWSGESWNGDSLFTPQAAEAWREWFKKNGVPRFEDMHQEEVRRAERKRQIHEKFLSFYPKEAGRIVLDLESVASKAYGSSFDRGIWKSRLSKHTLDLIALFPNRQAAALAVARSLGSLSMNGEGWRSGLTIEETLALEVAKTLSPDEYLFVTEQVDLPALLGAARLFFSEELVQPLPAERRGPVAARLCEAVLKGDQSRMSGDAVRHLKKYDCAETSALLIRLAAGEISAASEGFPKEFPQARVAAAPFSRTERSPQHRKSLRHSRPDRT
jgi:hypothetical protein